MGWNMIRVNLFISSFRKMTRRIVVLVVFLAICLLLVQILNYMYVDQDMFERSVWHAFYEEKENIDYLYLGSSHVYCDLNPFSLDELNDKNNFNLSTGSQSVRGSYYLLKEADRYHDLQHVYVELYYDPQIRINEEDLTRDRRCIDEMKNSFNRLSYIMSIGEADTYFDTNFPFMRFRNKIFDIEYIEKKVAEKKTEKYKNYEYRTESGLGVNEHQGKGRFYSDVKLRQGVLLWRGEQRLAETPLPAEAAKYLQRIINYCKKHKIELTLFSSPIYELQVLSTQGYDTYVRQIQEIADKNNITYYDFNLSKEEYLPIQKTEYFKDIGHLNAFGAEIYTNFFYQVMQRTREENKEYFYTSYEEKLRMQPWKLHGIYLLNDTEDNCELWQIASTWEKGLEYRVLFTPEEGNTVMLQDFSDNPYIVLNKDWHGGICTIVAREKGKEEVATLEVEY